MKLPEEFDGCLTCENEWQHCIHHDTAKPFDRCSWHRISFEKARRLYDICDCPECHIYGECSYGPRATPTYFCGLRPNRISDDPEKRKHFPTLPQNGSLICTFADCPDYNGDEGYNQCCNADNGRDSCDYARYHDDCPRGFHP
jgi:hypothetical protein